MIYGMTVMSGRQKPDTELPGATPVTVEEPELLMSEPPPFYQVVLLNDDYTPMEFVVQILQQYFAKNLEVARAIMLKIHYEGRGICGVFPQDIAATKVDLVMSAAQRAQHPLQCIMEAV